jgi:hypothetical protein
MKEYIIKVDDSKTDFMGGHPLLDKPKELIRCKDCVNRECDGRAGMVVCGITGESHSRLFFCGYGEREEKS